LHLVGILFPHIIDDVRSKPHQKILYTFTAAGTGAKFPNFIVLFVCSGGAAAQVVTFLDVCSSIWVQYKCHFFLHITQSKKKINYPHYKRVIIRGFNKYFI
jgi:hypothetical protein